MRAIWYAVTIVLGAIGALAILRAVELVAVGAAQASTWVQLLIGALCLLGAWKSLERARKV